MKLNKTHLREFFQSMYNRQEIWWNKNVLELEYPWSEDDILNEYKFCNVYRFLDSTSIWVIDNIIRNKKLTLRDKIFGIIVFRLYNKPETFQKHVKIPKFVDYKLNPEGFANKIIELEETGYISTNNRAYNINTWLSKGQTKGASNATIILPSVIPLMEEITLAISSKNINNLISSLKKIEGVSNFVSHEFFLDICYLDEFSGWKLPFDRNSYTSIGPGARGGLELIFSNGKGMKELDILLELSEDYLESIGDFKYVRWSLKKEKFVKSKFNLKRTDIEFWLCEYLKYNKMKQGYGRTRERYNHKKK